MKSRDLDPLKLDIEPFMKDEEQLHGTWQLADMDRLVASTHPDARELASDVTWQARGERREQRGGAPQLWLHVGATASLSLECQRCLKPVETPLAVERSFLFVHGEAAAAELDAESDDDVLAIARSLDLRALIEDELLLTLPLVPRHEVCPQPLPVADVDSPEEEAPHPFAALASLKRGGLPN